MNKRYRAGVSSLLWVVFTDSLGWGLAFSIFATLFFNKHSTFLPLTVTDTTRHMLYEALLAIYSVFMFVFSPIIGAISDRYGRKIGLKISMLGLTSGFFLSALSCYYSILWLLIVSRIISGMTAGSLSVAQAAIVDISTPQTKAFNLSTLVLANCLGFSLGPVLGGIFVSDNIAIMGATTFLLGATLSTLGYMGLVLFFDETYSPPIQDKKINILTDFLNIKAAFSKPVLSHYLFAFALSMIAYGLLFSNIPVYLHRYFDLDSTKTGFILTVLAIVLSASLIFGGKYILSYFEKIQAILVAQGIQFTVYLILSISLSSLLFNCILFGLISFFVGVMYIGLLTLISDATSKEWQGRIMGVIASLSSLTWGIGPLLSGGLSSVSISTAFLCCAALIFGGMLSLHFSRAALDLNGVSNS